jgi:hypothetical protein
MEPSGNQNFSGSYTMQQYIRQRSLPNDKIMNSLKFSLSLARDLRKKKHCFALSHPTHGHSSTEPPPKRLTELHFLEYILATGKTAKTSKNMLSTKHGKR